MAWRAGDEEALGRIVPLVQEELRQIARRCLRNERPDHSLQATALVNEAYLRLIDARRVNWQNRTHFLAMSARLMRRVLVDYARTKRAGKRGGAMVKVSLAEAMERADDIVKPRSRLIVFRISPPSSTATTRPMSNKRRSRA